jgi:glycosyltransferase involved in cell wall biosynthesis
MLERWFGPAAGAKTAVIHCGVDRARFAPPPSAAPSRDPALIRLVTVASLQPQKGHRVLVEACRLLRARGRTVHATFVGEGEERADLEARIAAAGLDGAVELVGAQPSDRVAAIVAAADIAVQPSVVLASGKTEGIPVALMEAMAAERPVVASRVSGIPELVVDGETGLLVEPGQADQLADAIERLIDDPALARRLAEAGRRRVLAEFDLHKTTDQLVAVFRAAAATVGR